MRELPQALAAMGAYRQFIVCKYEPRAGTPKLDKYPVDFRTGAVVSAHDPQVWTDAPTAIAAAAHWGAAYGIGFVFTEADPFFFVDLDDCAQAGAWSPVAQWCCQLLAGCAIERSVSGQGLHIFGTYTGAAPAHRSRNAVAGLELYHAGRFVALTGDGAVGNAGTDCTAVLPTLIAAYFAADAGGIEQGWTATPAEGWHGPKDDAEIIRRARASVSTAAAFGGKASFNDLWLNNIEPLTRAYPAADGRPYDASAADAALAQHLAFWTGKDCERIQRIMWLSKLARDKWTREDYLPRTILAAVGRQMDILTDRTPEPVAGVKSLAEYTSSKGGAEPPIVPALARVVEGSTFLSCDQQRVIFTGCVYVTDAHRILIPGGALLKPEQFKVMYGGYTFAMDTVNEKTTRDAWEAFTQSQGHRNPRADSQTFRPDLPAAMLVNGAVNTYWPIEVPHKPGDASRFLTHLRKLYPVERDAQILLCYMAAVVQHKGIKFQWAPLLQGVQGNGKTLFTRCVAAAIGDRYTHMPRADEISEKFNAWLFGSIFIGVEDINVPNHKQEILAILQPMITGDRLARRAMNQDQTMAGCVANFIFNTNPKDGLKVVDNERRFCTLACAQQTKADLERDGMTGDYFPSLYAWLRADGYAIVAELLMTMPIPDDLNPATSCHRAPETSTTRATIASNAGSVEQEISEAVEQGLPGFCGGWISTIMLDRLLERIGAARRITHNKRREMLAGMGYILHPALPDGRANNNVLPDNGKPRLFILRSQMRDAAEVGSAADAARAYEAANMQSFNRVPTN